MFCFMEAGSLSSSFSSFRYQEEGIPSFWFLIFKLDFSCLKICIIFMMFCTFFVEHKKWYNFTRNMMKKFQMIINFSQKILWRDLLFYTMIWKKLLACPIRFLLLIFLLTKPSIKFYSKPAQVKYKIFTDRKL